MGRIMTVYDVLNGITVFNGLFPVSSGEQQIANGKINTFDDPTFALVLFCHANFCRV